MVSRISGYGIAVRTIRHRWELGVLGGSHVAHGEIKRTCGRTAAGRGRVSNCLGQYRLWCMYLVNKQTVVEMRMR